MQFDRNKFKGSKVSSIKEQKEQEKSLFNSTGSITMHELKDGENLVRWYPPHPDGKNFLTPIGIFFMPAYKDSNGKRELGKKRVFNGRIHSAVGRDIVEEYIQFLTNEAKNTYSDETELKKYLRHVYGYNEGKKFTGGLTTPIKFIGYAEMLSKDMKSLGVQLLEVSKVVKERINDLALAGSTDDSYDPFSDPDNGLICVITKNLEEKAPVDKYKVAFKMPIHTATRQITDEQLAKFSDMPSLSKLYINSYKQSDFEVALEGLRIFDEQHGYRLFDNPSWIHTVNELKSLFYPSDTSSIYQAMDEDQEDMEDVEDEDVAIDELDGLSVTDLKALYKLENPGAKTYQTDTKAKLIIQIREEREIVSLKANHTTTEEPQKGGFTGIQMGDDDLPF